MGKEFKTFKHILFCTDFSENADFAFSYAVEQASRYAGCKLTLLHIMPEMEAQFWKTYLYEVDNVDNKAKQDVEVKIADYYAPQVPENVKFEIEIKAGKDYMAILEFAREKDVDLIVIGRQGKSSIKTILFGNVIEKITRHSECPILVIPASFQKRIKED